MLIRHLKKSLIIFLLPFLLMTSGCVYLIVGGVGALGGYIVSPDTVEGMTGHEFQEVWDSTIDIVSIMGTIDERQDNAGILISKINGTKVTITVTKVNSTTTKLTVKARKSYFPKITIAQEVFVKIMSNVGG